MKQKRGKVEAACIVKQSHSVEANWLTIVELFFFYVDVPKAFILEYEMKEIEARIEIYYKSKYISRVEAEYY